STCSMASATWATSSSPSPRPFSSRPRAARRSLDGQARRRPGVDAAAHVEGVVAAHRAEVLDRLGASPADPAVDVDRTVGGDLADPLGHLAEGDEPGPGDALGGVLVGLTHVDEDGAAGD